MVDDGSIRDDVRSVTFQRGFRRMVCGAAVAALFVHQRAQAEPTPSESENAARVLYEAGASAYAAGGFEAATQALAKAYSLAPRPTVLFSLAQAERRLFVLNGNVAVADSAVAHFRAYLAQVPHGGRRADVAEALGELAVLRARPAESSAEVETQSRGATRLLVSVEPPSAEVRVDGVLESDRPLILETTPGSHTLAVEARGYFGESRQVSAVAEGVVATEVRLTPKPATVRLVAAAGTQVWLDGTRLGTTPLGPLRVEAGSHRFELRAPGHTAETRLILAERGAELTVSAFLQLTTQRKLSHGLLVGGGLAALVGGAAAVTAVAFERDATAVERAAREGNISGEALLEHNRSLERRDSWRGVSVVSFAAAAGLVIGGGALYFWNPDGPPPEGSTGARVTSRWSIQADGVGLSL
jgi:PEGA domain